MTAVPPHFFLILAGFLFVLGSIGFLVRRNLIRRLLCLELMVHGASLSFVTFNRLYGGDLVGQLNALFIIVFAVAHSAVGLAAIVAFARTAGSVSSSAANRLQG